MRGKLGYKKPLLESAGPETRVTYFDSELLVYDQPDETARVTYFDVEMLVYTPPEEEPLE